MRALACALAMTLCTASTSFAQTEERPQAVYVELGGSSLLYSVNAEVPVAQTRALRIGAMYLPGVFGVTSSVNQFVGRGASRLVLGLGITLIGGIDNLAVGTATIGYRQMVHDGGFLQIAATPFITKRGVHRYVGVSFGHSF